jgi:membrane-associated protein
VQAVLLARFVPVVRTFAPIVAGIVNMQYRIFLTYNIVGGFLWAAGVTFAGYFLGSRVPFISEYLTQIALAIIFISFIPFLREMLKK